MNYAQFIPTPVVVIAGTSSESRPMMMPCIPQPVQNFAQPQTLPTTRFQAIAPEPPMSQTQTYQSSQNLPPESVTNQLNGLEDGFDLEAFQTLAKAFREKRVKLGVTQAQAASDFRVQGSQGSSYSQSTICRIEKMDLTPQQAVQLSPLIQNWLVIADYKYVTPANDGTVRPVLANKFVEASANSKRKRQKRSKIPEAAQNELVKHFEIERLPSVETIKSLADKLGMDSRTVTIWFRNRRQNTKKQINR